jgi:hypothetical protein
VVKTNGEVKKKKNCGKMRQLSLRQVRSPEIMLIMSQKREIMSKKGAANI